MNHFDPPTEHLQLIVNLFNSGKLVQALTESKTLLEKFPNSVFLHNISGASYAGLNQFKDAIKSYKKAIKFKPDFAEAYFNMAIAQKSISNFEEARPYLISFNKIVESWTKINPNGQNVFILDACRTVSNSATSSNNFSLMTKDGFLSFNSNEISGLVQTQLGSNTMIVYATSPGKPSYYNEKDENSIYGIVNICNSIT